MYICFLITYVNIIEFSVVMLSKISSLLSHKGTFVYGLIVSHSYLIFNLFGMFLMV